MRFFYRGLAAALVVAALVTPLIGWGRVSRRRIELELKPILQGGRNGARVSFHLEGCGIPVADLTRFLLVGTPFAHELRFAPGCDLEGMLPIDSRPALVDFKVRHLGRLRRLRGLLSSTTGGITGASFALSSELDDGEFFLEGHRAPAQVTLELAVGFTGVLEISRPNEAHGTVFVNSFDGEPSRFKSELQVE